MAEPFVGEIRNFAFKVVPAGWLPCKGQTLQIAQNQALFSLLGTKYGGDGKVNFMLPDLQGRVIVGRGLNAGKTTNYELGQKGGLQNVKLTTAQIPPHNHLFAVKSANGVKGAIQGNLLSSAGTSTAVPTPHNLYAPLLATGAIRLNPGSLVASGGDGAHSNMQPYLATNFCIATQGMWSPRQQ